MYKTYSYIEQGKLVLGKVQTVLSIIVAVCNVMLSKVDYLEKLKYERVRHSYDAGLENVGMDVSTSGSGNDKRASQSPKMVDDEEEKSLYYRNVVKTVIFR